MHRPWHQFSLRTMLVGVGIWGVACAIMAATGLRGAAVLAAGASLVALHLMGNALGRRAARRRGDDPVEEALLQEGALQETARQGGGRLLRAEPGHFAPPTRLGRKSGPGRLMFFITPWGGLVGGALGAWLLWREFHGGVEWIGFVLGVLSATTVGCFLSYLITTCLQTAIQALRDATADPTTDQRTALNLDE